MARKSTKKVNQTKNINSENNEQVQKSDENVENLNNIEPVNLQVTDIVNLLKMVEIAFKRNVYSEFEVNAVQQSFNRANDFVAQFISSDENAEEQLTENQ